jgi:hypothetical protein
MEIHTQKNVDNSKATKRTFHWESTKHCDSFFWSYTREQAISTILATATLYESLWQNCKVFLSLHMVEFVKV